MYKYDITPSELKEVRKYIIQDIKSNHDYSETFKWCLTLQEYLDVCKEILMGAVDEEGFLLEPDGSYHLRYQNGEQKPVNVKNMSSVDVCKMFMDGRGLFTNHFNVRSKPEDFNFMGKYYNWDNTGPHDENQWYHEDRLDDPAWFKFCVENGIGCSGHPYEHLCGNFYPVNDKSNEWYFIFSNIHSWDFYKLKGYLHLKKLGYPVFLSNDISYLTNKQKEKLGVENV